jgi:cbb3-type cytochrome c oxidase subunit III
MSQSKAGRYIVLGSSGLTVLIVGLTGFPISIVHANATQASAATATTIRTKCAICRGPDGTGSEVGKSMNVPHLLSRAVQQLTDAELAQTISDGKAGMPSFRGSFSANQIQATVKRVRTLAKRK